jgi:LPS export ABC transporter protein LptC
MKRFFNADILKLMLALGILFGIVGLVYYANHQADQQLKKFAAEKKEESTDAVVIDNYELREVGDDNNIHWQLQATKGTMEAATKDVNLENVHVNYYKEGKVSMTLSAPTGKANELSRIVKLYSVGDKQVSVTGDEKSAQLKTKELELTKNNQFKATGGVNIIMPGVAKVTGNNARGSFVKGALHKLIISGNTHALVDM